jgi:hypothetical protein
MSVHPAGVFIAVVDETVITSHAPTTNPYGAFSDETVKKVAAVVNACDSSLMTTTAESGLSVKVKL